MNRRKRTGLGGKRTFILGYIQIYLIRRRALFNVVTPENNLAGKGDMKKPHHLRKQVGTAFGRMGWAGKSKRQVFVSRGGGGEDFS